MDWLEGVKDGVTRALIARRIDRLRRLAGGSKRTQARDIERAKALAKALKDDTFNDRKARHGQDDPG